MLAKSVPMIPALHNNNDILCGRGGLHSFQHPGNQLLRALIVLKLDEYLQCKRKGEKTTIIRGVINTIQKNGGRFLKFDSIAKVWYDGGIACAKVRVGVAFRDAKSPNKVRYVKDLRSDIEALRMQHDETNTSIYPQKKKVRPFPAMSSSQAKPPSSLSSDVVRPESLASLIQPDIALTFVPTESRSFCTSTALDHFEPRSVDRVSDDEDIGVATAQNILDALSSFDHDSCYSSEEESIEQIQQLMKHHDPSELARLEADFINSDDEMLLDDFIHALSNAEVGY